MRAFQKTGFLKKEFNILMFENVARCLKLKLVRKIEKKSVTQSIIIEIMNYEKG
jgi:hypothetical protein